MCSKIQFLFKRLREKLWLRPLEFSLLAVLATIAAASADNLASLGLVPKVELETVEKLLSIIAASMLGVATFAVASMVSAYASVSSSATPRAFLLVVSDDVSKTALSTFIAAFIFSVIALIAIKSGFYGRTGLFLLFIMTIAVLGWVVFSFVRWVDQIARLGRLETTINRVEKAAEAAIARRRRSPNMGALPVDPTVDPGEPIFANTIGYVQQINVEALQACAEEHKAVLTVAALPGTFVAPGRAVGFLKGSDTGGNAREFDSSIVTKAFLIGRVRNYDEDPRFGLIALSEIAARALSPAVNDRGTAIEIIGTFVRLFAFWVSPVLDDDEEAKVKYNRVRVPSLRLNEMFDDAFTAIARDGADVIEIVVRLQKAFISLSSLGHAALKDEAYRHSELALGRAEIVLKLPHDIERARALANKLR